MLTRLFCLSAAALLATSGAFAEDSQNDSSQETSVERSLAGCGCGKTTKKGQEGSEGDKGNKNVVAHCDAEDEHVEEVTTPEIHLSCGGCKD